MKKIYQELSRIQKELKAPKNLFNKFGNYNYRNAEGILEAVKPMLNGMVLLINDEPVLVGDRFYIKATVTLTDGEDAISAVAYAREDETKKGMDGCQITGACSSYARKYALNALLMIDDAKDSDDDSMSPKNPANKPNEKTLAMLKSYTKLMMKDYEIADEKAMKRKMIEWRDALASAGVIDDVQLQDMTPEQVDAFGDAVYKNFKPSGEHV
jgi:hypothetical protein